MIVHRCLELRGCLGALLLACVLACSSSTSQTGAKEGTEPSAIDAPARAKRLTVIGTNDLHGHIEMLPLLGGYLDILRGDPERAVVLLDGGDMFQGTLASNLVEGASIVEAYELLRYDAVTIGNHEFDFGPVGAEHATATEPGQDPQGALKARAAEATFPFLSANILEAEASLAWPNVRPSILIKVKGVSVGIIGVSTYETPHVTLAANVVGLQMAPLAETIAREATALRKAGAEIVLVTAHAGGDCKELHTADDLTSCDEEQEIFQVARALPPGLVQAIVAGHTHQGVAHKVAGIAIIESFARGQAFGRVDFTVGEDNSIQLDTIHPPRELCSGEASADCQAADYEGKPVARNQAIAAIASAAESVAETLRSQDLGIELLAPVERSRADESALGNLFADLMLAAQPKAQVAITNGGSLRADLPAGPLLYGALFEAMPFDNRFALVTLPASELAKLIAKNLQRDSGILSIAGVQATAKCAKGELQVELRNAKGRVIAPNQPLTLATSDFLASGGDGLFAGQSVEVDTSDNALIRDAMAAELTKRGGTLDPSDKALFDPKHPRIAFAGSRPLRCR